MKALTCQIRGVGVLGPGLPDWPSARPVLAGSVPHKAVDPALPPPAALPANERRRATALVRLALAVATEALDGYAGEFASVFASSEGDLFITDHICRALLMPERPVSPTLFHNSVHNAPAGYLSIACRNRAPYTSISAVDETVAAGLLEAGPIQVVVNNAGMHDDAIMAGMRPEQWRRVIDVNLNGFFNVTQPLLLPMMQTRWGRIVNLSSVAGVLGNRGQTNYAAAKAGIIGATRSLAQEMASRGITVNAVAPGIIAGEMTDGIFDAQRIKALVPMGRAGTPQEVADLVAFLVSDRAAYVSGQVIGINGAMA